MQMEVVVSPTEDSVPEEELSIGEPEPVVEVFDEIEAEPESEDETASGRLANLRQEIGGDQVDDRQGSIEDRMKRFFGGNE